MIDFTQFRTVLEQTGYLQNHLTFGDGNVRQWDWERSRRLLEGKAKLLWEALLCGKEVVRAPLERAIGREVVRELLRRRLCSLSKGKISFGNHSLIYSQGVPFFFHRTSLASGYYGDDSRMAMTLPCLQSAPGRVLCLYSGTGAEALRFGGTVDVEAEESFHELIRTNLELNGAVHGRVQASFDGKSSGLYDVIAARVPSILELPGARLPFLISGGPDGHGKWRELLSRAKAQLASRGRLVFAGLYYGGKESSVVAKDFEGLFAANNLSASINISSKLAMEFGIPIFGQTILFAERSSGLSRDELMTRCQAELERAGYTHAYMVKGLAWKKRKGAPGSMLDLSQQYYGTWFL